MWRSLIDLALSDAGGMIIRELTKKLVYPFNNFCATKWLRDVLQAVEYEHIEHTLTLFRDTLAYVFIKNLIRNAHFLWNVNFLSRKYCSWGVTTEEWAANIIDY